MEQYKAQNVSYERDIPILQETVGGVWKKEDELKALKAEVAALERKIQLTLAPPKPEAGQEQHDGKVQMNTSIIENKTMQKEVVQPTSLSDNVILGQEHIHHAQIKSTHEGGKGIKL